MFERLAAWALRSPALALMMVALGLIFGTIAAQRLRIDAFPDLTDVQVQVLVDVPGLAPVEVERLVTFPTEIALNGLPRVKQIRSLSKYGFASITVVFEDGVDVYFARTLVSERLQGVRNELPPGAEASLGPLSGASSEIYMYTVEGGGQDLTTLRTIHDRAVKPRLRAVPGVTEINSFGGLVRQVQIVVRPERLTSYGLTLHDVVEAVEGNNALAAGGYLEHSDEQLILRGLGLASGLEDFRRTVVRVGNGGTPILLGDVADVSFGSGIRQGAVSRDGRGEVVTGIVMMLRGENSREVVRRVRDEVDRINRSLPAGVRVAPYYDQTDLVNGTLKTVGTNLLEGGLLVAAVLLVFLGNLRAALLVAATIPFSLLGAAIGMEWLGLSANLMTLGALDFGMLVDGSVVMAEQYVRGLHHDEQSGHAHTRSLRDRLTELAREVARPIGFGVLIILIVYIPILSLEGLEGRMFKPMALTVMFALLTSLLLALTFFPAAAAFVFRKGAAESAFAVRLAERLEGWYRPRLTWMVGRPGLAAAGAVVLLVGAGALVPRLGTEFLPELDEGSILIETIRDPSVSLSRSIAMQRAMETVVLETPEVSTVVSRVGRPEIGSDPMGIEKADVFVMLRPRSEWRRGFAKADIEAELEQALNARVPGLAFGFTQPVAMRLNELVSGVRADLAVKVYGDSLLQTRALAERIAEIVAGIPGASQVSVEQTQGQGYLNVRFDRSALARFGIPITEAQEALETAVAGKAVSQLVEGNWTVDVAVQYPAVLRSSPDGIGAITLPSPTGARIPLRQVADIRVETGPVQVSREATSRVVTVQANVRGRDLGGFAADVRSTLDRELALPTGTYLKMGGQFENQERAMARLQLVLPVALLLISALLYASLGSASLTGLVLVNLPIASVGGIIALWARGLHLGVSAAIGFIALFGVAVLNGLVLLTTVQSLRQGGAAVRVAAIDGAVSRLRPVLMTAMAASLGFLPVALSTGTGAEVQRPLATVVIGGLITSTLLTLLVLPSLYVWLGERTQVRASDAE